MTIEASAAGTQPVREQPQFVGTTTGSPPREAAEVVPSAPVQSVPAAMGSAPEYKRTLTTDLPPEALAERLRHAEERASREARAAILRELGIDDPGKFKSERQKAEEELKRYRESEEKRRRAEMTEVERYKTDLAKVAQEKAALEAQLVEAQEVQVSHEQEQRVRAQAQSHVDPEMYEYARVDFVAHLKRLEKEDPTKLDSLTDRDIDKFFRDLVKRRPKLAKAVDAPAIPEASKVVAKPQVRVPITTGAPPVRRPAVIAPTRQAQQGEVNGKTFKPNQPNSMSKGELNNALKQRGIKQW